MINNNNQQLYTEAVTLTKPLSNGNKRKLKHENKQILKERMLIKG